MVTEATGTFVSVPGDVPFLPWRVGVIGVAPAATPVTNPLALTKATAALLVAHVTVRPVRAVPFKSFAVAVNWVVAPTMRLAAAGLTVTEATGTVVTALAEFPAVPAAVAVIAVGPA